MDELWLKDINLCEIRNTIEKYKIISFDIFDTLIFRAVDKPKDIFEIVYEEFKKNIFSECSLTKEEFREMRIIAENNARQRKNHDKEVNLEEIYNELKYLSDYKEELILLELKVEKENIFLNPVIYSLLKYLKKIGKKVILISDMYIKESWMREILVNANININYIDKIFISCEERASKRSGDLYSKVLEYYNLNSCDILHIGDNKVSDVEGAILNNIDYCHYDAISKKHIEIELEQIKFGKKINVLNNFRKIVLNLCADIDEKERFWYKIGIRSLAPFLTLFSQWTVRNANSNNVKCIYPFMREGVILTKTIKQACYYNKYNINVEPLYISREATMLASLDKIDDNTINSFFDRRYLTVKEMLNSLGIYEYIKDNIIIEELENLATTELTKEQGLRLKKIIYQNTDLMNKEIVRKKFNIISYLREKINYSEKIMTADLGYKGTIQHNLQKILNSDLYNTDNLSHLLCVGSDKLCEKLIEGIKITAYVSSLDDSLGLTNAILWEAGIIEELMNDERGSTIGYDIVDGRTVPLLADGNKHEDEIRYKNICQEGILFFQKLFYETIFIKNNKKSYSSRIKESIITIARLLEIPTKEEVINLINLHHDENMGTSYISTFISESDVELAEKNDYYRFMEIAKIKRVMWPQGVATLHYSNKILLESIKNAKIKPKYFVECANVVTRLIDKGIESVIIYGAGEVGQTLVDVLNLYKIKVEFIIDRKSILWGKYIEDAKIVSLNDVNINNYENKTIVIASFSFIKEIRRQIECVFNNIDIIEI